VAGAKTRLLFVVVFCLTEVMPFYKARFDGDVAAACHENSNAIALRTPISEPRSNSIALLEGDAPFPSYAQLFYITIIRPIL